MAYESERGMVDAAQDTAERLAQHAEMSVSRLRSRANDMARDADDRLETLTGRSIEGWARELRHVVRAHPLQAFAVTIGIGYVIGKLMRAR